MASCVLECVHHPSNVFVGGDDVEGEWAKFLAYASELVVRIDLSDVNAAGLIHRDDAPEAPEGVSFGGLGFVAEGFASAKVKSGGVCV